MYFKLLNAGFFPDGVGNMLHFAERVNEKMKIRIAGKPLGINRRIAKHKTILLAMKMTAIILIATCLQVSAKSFGQITLQANEAPLEQIFQAIEQQTDYVFFFDYKVIRAVKKVSVEVKNASLKKTLEICFKGQPLTYSIVGNTIVVKKKTENFLPGKEELLLTPSIAIKGRVVDENGEALVGVSIIVKGSTKGTSSDYQGNFSLDDLNDNSVLVFSSIGFEPLEVSVEQLMSLKSGSNITADKGRISKTASGEISIVLMSVVSQLEDIVVVPYGKQERATITGSVVTVTSEELEGRPRTSFQESLQGKVAGLQSTIGSGQPGASGNVRIRGTGSINASSTPLYVVDGVPFNDMVPTVLAFSSNPLASINPNDIASITVLKDAAATSIYGSRAANGVILITTKSGKAGKTKINASAQYGITQMIINDRNRALTTKEMTELLIEGVINSQSSSLIYIDTPEEAYDFLLTQGLKPDINTDWFDVITQTGKLRQYNISASGGTATNNFFASLGYYKQDAATKGQGYERVTGRIRVQNNSIERLKLNFGFAPSYQKLNTIGNSGLGQNPIRSLNRLVPWTRPYNDDGTYSSIAYNPEIVRKENLYDTRIYSALGDFGAELKILSNLAVESKVAIDMSYADDYRYWSPLWVDGAAVKGRAAQYGTTTISWNITNLLKYEADLGDDLNFNVTLGQEANKKSRKRVSTQADGFARKGLYNLSSASTPYVAWSDFAETSLLSYFLNTNVNLGSRFTLNLTGRIDGSSMFGSEVRYAKFGSIGASWNVHEEYFMESVDFVDELKVRASYGINGNLYNEWYGVDGYYSTTAVYNGEPAYILSQIENQRLTWEKNKPFDIGLDFSLFNHRLSGTFDYFKRITTDLLLNAGISATNGVGSQNRNIGSMENYGIELMLSSRNIVSLQPGGFNWNTSFNISTGKNVITSLGGVTNMVAGVFNREIGGDFYQFYMKEWAGVDPETGNGLWYLDADKRTVTPVYDSAIALNQGIARPKFFGGLTNSFDYKGFTLSFMFYVNWGGQIFDNWGTYTSSDGSAGTSDYGAIARVDYENRWQKKGDKATSPKIVYGGSQTGLSSQYSSRFLYDASYIRLRDVTLSYRIPRNKYFQNATVYFRANNLFTYVKDDRLRTDPETYVGGILNQNLPIARQLLIGVDITL